MNTAEALKHITKELKHDRDYRFSWQANIAMAFKDRYSQYKKEMNKKVLSNEDIHVVANDAADYFLKLLCDEFKYLKGR